MLRTHTCGELRPEHVGTSVTLCGWINRRRDHGGLIFLDVRDHYGVTQIVINPEDKDMFAAAEKVRSEWVLKIDGEVVKRSDSAVRAEQPTGAIEVKAKKIEVLSEAQTPPFEIDQEKEVNEEVRLKYRYLDLRRPRMQEIMVNRDRLITHIREYMHRLKFTEVTTPILANSSPEGARDYLVPSRIHPGQFYALPQAPQQFKQLLMVAGLDRYFQIAPCFRDEDPRADRHPGEFYQLDLEMSFVTQEDVWNTVEPLFVELTDKFSDKKIINPGQPFPRIPWKEAMNRFGVDKPDLRYGLEIQPVTDLVKGCGFSVFAGAVEAKGVVHALKVEGAADFTRGQIDDLTQVAKDAGAKGLAYILVKDEISSPIVKFLGDDLTKKLLEHVGAKKGDAVFFAADSWKGACKALGQVRIACAKTLGLQDPKKAAWVWITDFPMYEHNDEGKVDFSHNPFSMPQGGMEALLTKDPLDILAYQYDIVCNGFELTSGAIRNHRPDIMYKAFEIAGYTQEDVDKKFGGMINAFKFGAPPHGGCAPGIDRLMMVLWECPSIRDIYAFPKNGKAQDVMMNAPSFVMQKQLDELSIKVVAPK